MSTTKNLWGELPLAEAIRTPAVILREQANQLTELTNGLLEGEVASGKNGSNKIYHQLIISAPSLDGYRYSVIYATHEALVYPCIVQDSSTAKLYNCNNENEFLEKVEFILSSESVHKIIGALLAQSKAEVPLGL